MKNTDPVIREFYLIFQDANCWWRYLLKPNFSHVMILMKDPFNWVLVDPSINTIMFTILPFRGDDPVEEVIKHSLFKVDCKVVKFRTEVYTSTYISPKLRFLTCTLLIRYIIGVQLPGFTPYSMYKCLMKIKNTCKIKRYGRNIINDIQIIKD